MEYWALVMFAVAIAFLLLGFPVAFTLGAVSMVFGAIFLGIQEFQLLPMRIWGVITNFSLLAVPLFVFMGVMLEKSGIAEELLKTMGRLFGRMSGGLAVSVVAVGTLLAATTGVVGATVVTMGIIALPAMLKYGYDKGLACGAIAASGTLGQIIPPSIILILLGDVVGVPVGELFAAAVVPGLILVAGFIVYILIIAYLRPNLAPTLPTRDDGAGLGRQVLNSLLPPLFLVVAVLGSIFFGVASPTESAAVGALGAMILAALHKRMTYKNLRDTANQTTRLTSMVFMILVGATAFGLVFRSMGGDFVVEELMMEIPGGKWG
ncbi:MAG TPA: TRAP transporter large permease subunit, partial [Candidatus Tenderia sp.]|nr:TRAP transporter large permease subunit [Candidatus Tenderia sp.]